jgi:hypothetical protein
MPSLLEVSVGVAILAVGALAVTSTGLASSRLEREDAEHALARRAALEVASEVATAAAVLADDRISWARRLPERFESNIARPVVGLEPIGSAPGVLTIDVVTDETASDAALGTLIGLPRDLDGDGRATSFDVASSAKLLPVVVRVRWSSDGSPREFVHGFFVQVH